jgi:hypothetical protein
VIEDVFRGVVQAATTDRFQELERRYVRRHDGHWALRKAFTTHVLPTPQSDVVLPSPSPTRLGLIRSRVARLCEDESAPADESTLSVPHSKRRRTPAVT